MHCTAQVKKADDSIGPAVEEAVKGMQNGEVRSTMPYSFLPPILRCDRALSLVLTFCAQCGHCKPLSRLTASSCWKHWQCPELKRESPVSADQPTDSGQVLVLENVRFYKEETKNDPGYAEKLAANADLYVNDAFGTAHRAHASTEGGAPSL